MAKNSTRYIYKLFIMHDWRDFEKSGAFHGAAIDIKDGYIHFSSADHVKSTADKYFSHEKHVIVAKIDTAQLPKDVVWEPARGDILFPHLYDIMPLCAVTDFEIMERDEMGQLRWPTWISDISDGKG